MSDLAIQRVATYRQRKQFLEFPWTLYRGDPNWIPPLRLSQKELVGYAPHPFYERNRVQTFLATRGGKVCGRIAAILNQGHNERYRDAAASSVSSSASTTRRRPTACWTPRGNGSPTRAFTVFAGRPIRR